MLIALAAASSLCAQTCLPSASTFHILDELQTPDDVTLPATERLAHKVEIVRKGLAAAPDDIYLHEAYQHLRIGGREADGRP